MGCNPWGCRAGHDLGTKQQHRCISEVVAHVQLLLLLSRVSRVRLFVTPRTAARQASLSFTISRSLLKFLSIES